MALPPATSKATETGAASLLWSSGGLGGSLLVIAAGAAENLIHTGFGVSGGLEESVGGRVGLIDELGLGSKA